MTFFITEQPPFHMPAGRGVTTHIWATPRRIASGETAWAAVFFWGSREATEAEIERFGLVEA